MTLKGRMFRDTSGSMRRTFGLIAMAGAFLIGAATFAQRAEAQMICVAHDKLAKQLGQKHGEQPVAMGLASNGALMEVFSSKEGVSWTIVLTKPNGVSCIMAAGESWMDVPKPLAGELS